MNNSSVIRDHILAMRRDDLRAATIHHRRANLERLAEALPCPLLEADEETLHLWQDDLRRRLAVASVRAYTSHARKFYAWAADTGRIEHDPARRVRPPRVPAGRAKPISEQDLRRAIACASEPIRTWLILAAFLGLRAGEIARLRRESVEFDQERVVVDGKGGKERVVPLPKEVASLLGPFVHQSTVGQRIFRTRSGRGVLPTDVSKRTNTHLHDCAIVATLHKLRHRYATRMYELSKDPRLVQELLGHSSLATTTAYLAANLGRGQSTAAKLARQTLGAPQGRQRSARGSARAPARSGWAATDEAA